MKIGLLTVYSFNYGSFYQAVALKRTLEELGHKCDLINERVKEEEWLNIRLLYKFYRYMPKILNNVISYFLPQYNTFLKLQNDISNYSQSSVDKLTISDLSNEYDCIVLGSDELWSASSKSIRYTKMFFGHGINCPHIAYAPSATLFDLNNTKLVSEVKAGLETFSDISVRDTYSQTVIKKIIGKMVPVVLDPTLLNPFFINSKNSENKGYILIYGEDYSVEQIQLIKTKAKENNWKISCLGWPHSWADEFINPDSAIVFQNAFKYAEYCFPSTFHGTIFSILHEKQFMSMTNSLRNQKVRMLLEQLDLIENIYKEGSNTIIPLINYENVNKKISTIRKNSLDYLINALSKIEVLIKNENL